MRFLRLSYSGGGQDFGLSRAARSAKGLWVDPEGEGEESRVPITACRWCSLSWQ